MNILLNQYVVLILRIAHVRGGVLWGGGAILYLFRIPGLIPLPLSSLRVFYPKLGYTLISGGALGFCWSIIYALLNLKK